MPSGLCVSKKKMCIGTFNFEQGLFPTGQSSVVVPVLLALNPMSLGWLRWRTTIHVSTGLPLIHATKSIYFYLHLQYLLKCYLMQYGLQKIKYISSCFFPLAILILSFLSVKVKLNFNQLQRLSYMQE